jgi:predicted DNA-binding transcriptional regulator AlpA
MQSIPTMNTRSSHFASVDKGGPPEPPGRNERTELARSSFLAVVRAQLASHVVDVAGAALVLGVSERQFYELRKRNGFPKARCLSERVSRYLVSELLAWLADQPASLEAAEPQQLARGRVYRGGRLVNADSGAVRKTAASARSSVA